MVATRQLTQEEVIIKMLMAALHERGKPLRISRELAEQEWSYRLVLQDDAETGMISAWIESNQVLVQSDFDNDQNV